MLFSIITVCRNNLQELILTHSSIADQSLKDFEWIVIDGGSTDGTREWLGKNHTNGTWISEKDEGIYDAMNKGSALARGKFLVYMNSGDEFCNNDVLMKIQQVINDSGESLAFIYGDSIDVDEEGREYYRKAKKHTSIKYGMITQHQAMFFKNDILPAQPYSESYKLSADYGLISSIIKSSTPGEIKKLEFPVCKFKMGGTNESKRFLAMKEDLSIRKKILNLSATEANWLYFLHYNHALLKHLFKKARFLRHKEMVTS